MAFDPKDFEKQIQHIVEGRKAAAHDAVTKAFVSAATVAAAQVPYGPDLQLVLHGIEDLAKRSHNAIEAAPTPSSTTDAQVPAAVGSTATGETTGAPATASAGASEGAAPATAPAQAGSGTVGTDASAVPAAPPATEAPAST